MVWRTCCFTTNDRNTAVNITSNLDIIVRFNSFASGQTYVNEGGTSTPNVRVIGNILGTPNCVAGAVYQFNLVRGGTCGANSMNIASMPYVNGSNLVAMDYHLSVPLANEFVTSGCIANDFDGQPRAAPCEAGSDEQ